MAPEFPEVVRMARRVRARCPNDVRAREETTSGAVVVLAKGDVTDRTGDDDLKKKKGGRREPDTN